MNQRFANDYIPDLYDPKGLCSALSMSRSQVYSLLRNKKLESLKIGKSRRVTRSQLETFIQRAERGDFEVS